MKSKLVAIALFLFTAGGITFYPTVHNIAAASKPSELPQLPPHHPSTQQQPKIEVVFALDTTGSMGGLIQAAKEKIWSIASTMAQAQPAPEIKMGLVAYRDRGDEYVTQVVDLSSDLDTVYAALMDFQAGGGGDGPESVNQALVDAVDRISWSRDQSAYKVIFLVGDAPPHMDYQDDVKYPQTLGTAKQKGILVNTILAGNDEGTREVWQRIAQTAGGRYAQVQSHGDAVAIATPYDEKMAELSAELDETRLYYGSDSIKAKRQLKKEATSKLHESASVTSRARRAAYNSTHSGKSNLLGDGELVEDVLNGRVDFDTLANEELPASMQSISPRERKSLVEKTAKRRDELNKEISKLAAQRDKYLREKVEAEGDTSASLDQKLYDTVRKQASQKGMSYPSPVPSY
jgi:Mg-chelatase subunit ChlD